MTNIIKKLQNKPRFIRIQVLWISVILVMIIIFSFWLVFLKTSLQASKSEEKPSGKEQSIPSLPGTLKEDFFLLKKSLQAGVEGIMTGNKKENFEVEIIKPGKLPE